MLARDRAVVTCAAVVAHKHMRPRAAASCGWLPDSGTYDRVTVSARPGAPVIGSLHLGTPDDTAWGRALASLVNARTRTVHL
jgi:hypothetical protein